MEIKKLHLQEKCRNSSLGEIVKTVNLFGNGPQNFPQSYPVSNFFNDI